MASSSETRINAGVSIPLELAQRIQRICKATGLQRSTFWTAAATEKLDDIEANGFTLRIPAPKKTTNP